MPEGAPSNRGVAHQDGSDSVAPAGTGSFRTTHWSMVVNAAQEGSPEASQALDRLCRVYWYPLYCFVRRSGYAAEQAQDLTQSFFVHLLEKHLLAKVRREKGRFRSFLLACLKNYLSLERQKAQAKKRGGDRQIVSLKQDDAETRYQAEPAEQVSPDHLFERRWAAALLDQVMRRLEAEYKEAKKAELFDRLQILLAGSERARSYAEIGAELGMSEGAIKAAVHRLRKRYGQLLREGIVSTVATPEEVEEEIRHLMGVLAR